MGSGGEAPSSLHNVTRGATLYLKKQPLMPVRQKTGQAPKLVWTWWWGEKFLPRPECLSSSSQMIIFYYYVNKITYTFPQLSTSFLINEFKLFQQILSQTQDHSSISVPEFYHV